MLIRALAVWFGLLVAAFLVAVCRVAWLAPAVGDRAAYVISAVVLSAIVAAVAWAAIVWVHPHSANEALLVGDEWVLLTIAFQVVGYYVIGTAWHTRLMEYNVSKGALWEIVLVTMLVAPTFARFGHRRELRLASPQAPVRRGSRSERTRMFSSARKAIFGRYSRVRLRRA